MLAHAFLAVATAIERDHTPTTPSAPARPDRLKLDRLAASRADIVAISARIKELDAQIPALLKALGCTLTAIHGIGVVTAMTLLTKIGDPAPVQHGSTVSDPEHVPPSLRRKDPTGLTPAHGPAGHGLRREMSGSALPL